MANRKTDMDQIFKKKLDNLEIKAPGDSWTFIESQLPQPENNRKIFFYRYAAAASIALIAVSAALFTLIKFNNTSINNRGKISVIKSITEKQPLIIPEIKTYQPITRHIKSNFANLHEVSISDTESIISESDEKNKEPYLRQTNFYKLENRPVVLFAQSVDINIKECKFYPVPKNLTESSAELLAANQLKKSKNSGKWAIGIELAPSYSYRHLSGSGSQESVAYFNTVENPIQTFSGGVNVQYKIYKRLTVQSGIYYSQMGQSIGNMTIYDNKNYDNATPANKSNYLSSITLTNSVGNININSKYVFVDQTNFRVNTSSENKFFFDPNDPSLNQINSKVQQNFEYLDIPIMFRFKFIDKKVDVNLAAGISASFLVGNKVTLVINETETNIGKTKSISDNNFTGNIGLSLDLPLASRFTFRLEPGFKYFFNAINSDPEIESHPYSFSVFSGFCLSL